MIIDDVKKSAVILGECGMLGAIKDYKELCRLLFSPQGREFCERHNFPALKQFQAIQHECDVSKYGVFIDSNSVCRSNDKDIALIGNTQGELRFDDNKVVHKIILMHGAKAIIRASNYVVLLVVKIGDCEVDVKKDETVVVL